MTDSPNIRREQLEADVLIIGAGPGGLACALHLANLIEKHNEAKKSPALSAENIYVLEKGREIGAHQLSGAIMDPRGLRELVPDFEKTAPLDTPVTGDAAYYFTEKSSFKLPITPPPLQNHGNYVISLNKLVKWLGGAGGKEKRNRRRPYRRQGCGQERQAERQLHAGLRAARENHGARRGAARIADEGNGEPPEARRPESAGVRHRHQGIVGCAAWADRDRL